MAIGESHSLLSELIDVGGLDVAAVAAQIRPARVVEQNQEEIGRRIGVEPDDCTAGYDYREKDPARERASLGKGGASGERDRSPLLRLCDEKSCLNP